MTREELYEEIEVCQSKIHALNEEIITETDLSVVMSKYNEIMKLRDRANILNGINTALIISDYDAEVGKLTKQLMRDLILFEGMS